MSVASEPGVLRASLADTTSAVINTLKTSTIVAAPGATSRFRLYAVTLAFDLGTSTPVASTGILGQIGGTTGPYISIAWPQQPGDAIVFPMGVWLGTNAALTLRTWPSVATAIPFVVNAEYVVETV